ncbi:helix-turn-helix transcriptional regulator [Fodinicola feengrottensis]|uniref:HTH luxR-type domain-containing protein n=1 Tax=Fodinicola feengrottensis TaxID=435914 RepID=A0ABN2HKI9_9ACTN|nr:LuxR C-terminal-related transcriptional regulator [Fodinicola feengrottensis]
MTALPSTTRTCTEQASGFPYVAKGASCDPANRLTDGHCGQVMAALEQRIEGLTACVRGNRARARHLLDAAATALQRAGASVLAAQTRLEWAELADPADPEVRRAIAGCLEIFDHAGLSSWTERARAAMPRTTRQRWLEPLSRREAEVAELVSRGHSNRRIAHQLSISERTVEARLHSAYTRLDLASRVSLAAWVIARQT